MARAAGIEWKAVGASLDTLAATMSKARERTPAMLGFASGTVLQQAGVVLRSRYIVPGAHAVENGSRINYTAPPGATHGPIKTRKLSRYGEPFGRDERGRWHNLQPSEVVTEITTEQKLFVKGKFVSRTKALEGFANELATAPPEERVGYLLAVQPGRTINDDLEAGVDENGGGYLVATGGYAAAERGSRKMKQNGVRGIWRALRSVQGRWATIVRKKYPDLLKLPQVRTR